MGEAKRRRAAALAIERTVHDPDLGVDYQVRAALTTPRQLIEGLRRSVSTDEPTHVPCNGCTQCCWWPRVDVDPVREPPERLRHLDLAEDEEGFHLRKRADGACIHLGDKGCTVHEHRPRACRAFDCRPMSFADALFPIDERHYAPFWFFPHDDPEDKAILAAAKMGLVPHVVTMMKGGKAPNWEVALRAMLEGIVKHLPMARKLIASIDELPAAKRTELLRLAEQGRDHIRATSLKAHRCRGGEK